MACSAKAVSSDTAGVDSISTGVASMISVSSGMPASRDWLLIGAPIVVFQRIATLLVVGVALASGSQQRIVCGDHFQQAFKAREMRWHAGRKIDQQTVMGQGLVFAHGED